MSRSNNAAVWYELRTQRGNTIIMKDDELPLATKGRVYLYNTDRDAIIEYDSSIVSSKLFALDDTNQADAHKKFGSAWQEARKQLLKKHGKYSQSANDAEAEQAKAEPEEKELTAETIEQVTDSDDDDLFDEDED